MSLFEISWLKTKRKKQPETGTINHRLEKHDAKYVQGIKWDDFFFYKLEKILNMKILELKNIVIIKSLSNGFNVILKDTG